MVNGKPFAIVPYTLVNNDIELMAGCNFGNEQFYQQLLLEFDQLYRESKTQRRMVSISSHARIGGQLGAVTAYRRFIEHAGSKSGVWFVRKDWMAKWASENLPRYGCPAFPTSSEVVEVNVQPLDAAPF